MEFTQRQHKPECVIVDTSVWRSEPLLKTPLGMTLVYTIYRTKGFIGLPEVVELELTNQIVEAGLDARNKVLAHCGVITRITDVQFQGLLPTPEQLEKRVEARLIELSPILVREPFTLEHAKAALRMVNDKLPPNGKDNQQFKDSAIWQAALSLSLRHTTHLVTNDKGFFKNREPANGLAFNLEDDCRRAGVEVTVHYGIKPCLEAVGGAKPQFDRARVEALVVAAIMPILQIEAAKQRFAVREVIDVVIEAFGTDEPNKVAVDYTIKVRIEDDASVPDGARRTDCVGVIHGSSYYDLKTNSLDSHYVQQLGLLSKNQWSYRSFRDYDSWAQIPRPIDLE